MMAPWAEQQQNRKEGQSVIIVFQGLPLRNTLVFRKQINDGKGSNLRISVSAPSLRRAVGEVNKSFEYRKTRGAWRPRVSIIAFDITLG